MKNEKNILIIGASGLIGEHTYNLLKSEGKEVIGTYNKNKREGLIHFNLVDSSLSSLPLEKISHALICSAITNLDECKKNPEHSHEVNVKGIERIISDLIQREILPIFISSGAIFDGIKGGYKEDSERNPISLYGKQKVEVENFITSNTEDYLIIRPGKICDFHKLFSDWFERYKKGDTILCANDEKQSFTSPKDIARAIDLLIEKNSRGIYHLNQPNSCSRFELATKFFEDFGIQDAKIKGCSLDDFGGEKRAKCSFMDASKFIQETGFEFTSIKEYYKSIDTI
ncbi:MAG: sugar nucleotide-binding protein [Candidatus Pacearchaeota archaeon]|nr:sugar nucleotide-binding protein [Candidatus Pacearchaeota archaeon]